MLFRLVEAWLSTGTARVVAASLLLAGIAGLLWHWLLRARLRAPGLPPADQALLLLVLLAPVVNPWYWLWALAPAVLAGRCAVAAVAGASALSYLNTSVLREAGWLALDNSATPFSVGWPIAIVQLTVLGLAWTLPRVWGQLTRLPVKQQT